MSDTENPMAPVFHAPAIMRRERADLVNIDALAQRVYAGVGFVEGDFRSVRPGLVVVKPIRPPKIVGGMEVPEAAWSIPGQLCVLHQVVAVSDIVPDGCLSLVPGDVVVCMLAFLDPLDAKGDLLDILHDKIVNKIGHAAL